MDGEGKRGEEEREGEILFKYLCQLSSPSSITNLVFQGLSVL